MTLPIRGSLLEQRGDNSRWRARPLKRRAARGRAKSEIGLSDRAPADGLDQAAPVKKDDHVDPALIRSWHIFEALQDAETVREARAGLSPRRRQPSGRVRKWGMWTCLLSDWSASRKQA